MGMIENKISRLAEDIDDLTEFFEERDVTVAEVLEALYRIGLIDLEEELKQYEGI